MSDNTGFPFRIDCAIEQGLSISISGVLPTEASLKDKDKLVDEMMDVVERQHAKKQIVQWTADLEAKKNVLEQERKRAAEQHTAHEKSPNDYTKSAIDASTANIQRLERDIAAGQAAIDGLLPELRA